MGNVVNSGVGVTLVGGGAVGADDLRAALECAPTLVAADGGGNALADLGHIPVAVIGDMDSLREDLRSDWSDLLHPIAEQDSTDLDKCLRSISAPFVLGVGFGGARLDHTLSAMTALVRHRSARVLLVCEQDVCFLCPPRLALTLPPGARVSLFPMAPVSGRSQGLHWPIDGIPLAPGGVIGTSNRTDDGAVQIHPDAPALLVLLARSCLPQALAAVMDTPDWRS